MSKPSARSLFFRNARQLLTLAGSPAPRRGRELEQLGIIRDGAVLTAGGKIIRVGTTRELDAEARRFKARAIDCRGRGGLPGFVDSHTHLGFHGSPVADYEWRIQ